LGTAGTLMGISRALKARKPSLRVVGVEPAQAPFISQGTFRPHRIMGTAPGFVPGVLDRDELDAIELITEEEAFEAVRRMARTEGLLVGITGGATAAVAARIAQPGQTVVCIVADSGQRYLSVQGLFGPTP
jgi:cysteine synthase